MPVRIVISVCACTLGLASLLLGKCSAEEFVLPRDDFMPVPVFAEDAADDAHGQGEDLQTLKDRLEKLEQEWSEHQNSVEIEEKEKASKPTYKLNGRIHADYWVFPDTSPGIGFFENPDPTSSTFGQDPEDFFGFRRIRLELSGTIPESMLWRIQVDFNNPSNPEIKDVYAGFTDLPLNQELLIGNQKRPLGLDHLNSSRYNVFMERPFVIEAFNEDARRPGITMYGYTDDESLGWAYGVYLLENIATTGMYRGDATQPSINSRLFGSPWYEECGSSLNYVHWGIAGMFAHPDGSPSATASNDNEARFRTRPEARSQNRWLDTGEIEFAQYYEILGLESIVNVGPLQVVGEYQANWLQRQDVAPGGDLFFHGFYVYVSYFLTGESIPYDRTTGTIGRVIPFHNFILANKLCGRTGGGWGAWNVAFRYDHLDLTDDDITGGIGQAGTVAVNWFFNPFAKLQFDLSFGRIDERGPIGGYNSGEYLLAGTRFAIEF